MKQLGRRFFERRPEVVARALLGKFLIRKNGLETLAGIITETEAYLSEGDKASHSHKGKTKRNEVMFGPAGFAYVYFTYGMHWLLNFITEREGKPSGVLIRAIEPLGEHGVSKKITSGPAKLTKWMGINGDLNRMDVVTSKELFVAEEVLLNGKLYKARKYTAQEIISRPRIGVSYAGEDAELPLRFYLAAK